jgi:hypothetical protein
LVDAAAEPDMPDRATPNVVLVRPVPLARIAIGGAREHQHFFAFADGNAANLDRPPGSPILRKRSLGARRASFSRPTHRFTTAPAASATACFSASVMSRLRERFIEEATGWSMR